jgi:hypothetical protein
MTATYRKKLVEVAEYPAIPYVWPALVANNRIRFDLAFFVYRSILSPRTALIPSLVQNGPDFQFGRVDAALGDSHTRIEARS